jgi:hypothetical protein
MWLLKRVHAYAGLLTFVSTMPTAAFSMPFLLVYAIGAVEFAHREWLPRSEISTEETANWHPVSWMRGFWLANGAEN